MSIIFIASFGVHLSVFTSLHRLSNTCCLNHNVSRNTLPTLTFPSPIVHFFFHSPLSVHHKLVLLLQGSVRTCTRLTRDDHYKAYRERQKSTIQRQKPSIQRGIAKKWANKQAMNHAHRLSVIQACTCPHNPSAAYSHVKRPSNAFMLFRCSTTFPDQVYALMDLEARHNYARGKKLSVEKASALWKIVQEDPMFANVKADYEKQAKDEATRHQLLYPGYHYQPSIAATNDFGDENCVCGARELNLSARRDREAGIRSNKKQTVKPNVSHRAKPRYDSDSDELSDPPTDLDSEDDKPTPRTSSGYGTKRTPRTQHSTDERGSRTSVPPSPAPTPSRRPTRGAKGPVKTVAQKTIIKPSPFKGYAYEVTVDEDDDEDMEE